MTPQEYRNEVTKLIDKVLGQWPKLEDVQFFIGDIDKLNEKFEKTNNL